MIGHSDSILRTGSRFSSSLFVGASVLCGVWAATAQAQTVTAPAENSADEHVSGDIVVTAQRRGERMQDVPISVSSLSGDHLEAPTVRSVSDALQTVPAVAITKGYSGGGSLIAVRGVSAGSGLSFGASPIAYYLDAVPFGLIKSAVAPDPGVYDLQRIEVLRGPQGTLYGASAENGVVRVLTADPDLNDISAKIRGSAATTLHGGESYRADAAMNLPLIEDKLALRAVIGGSNEAGWIDQPNRKDVNEGKNRNYRMKLRAKPVDDLDIIAAAWISREHQDAPSIGITHDTSLAVRAQPVDTDFETYSIKAVYDLPGFSITSASSFLNFKNKSSLDLLPYGLVSLPGVDFITIRNGQVYSQEGYVTSKGTDNWRWSVGAAYRRATEDSITFYTPAIASRTDQHNVSNSIAVFGELTRLFFDRRLELTAGVRYFHDKIKQNGTVGVTVAPGASSTAKATTPRFVVTYHATPQLTVYASYAQGFRSGFPQNITVPAGFDALAPDKINNYEVGAKGSLLDNAVSFELAVFHIDWKNVQQTVTIPFQGLAYPLYVNSGSASGNGVDFSLTVRPVKGLQFAGAIGYNGLESDSRVLTGGFVLFNKGDRLNYSPKLTAGASADYAFDIGNSGLTAVASVAGTYTSSQINRLFVGSFVNVGVGDGIVIGKASFAVSMDRKWTATAFVDNFNNEKGTPVFRPTATPNWSARVRPRTFGLQLEYRY